MSLTGGLYAYVEVAFGPFVGFLAGVLYFLMATFAVASVSSAFAGSVGALWPPADVTGRRAALIVVALRGARRASTSAASSRASGSSKTLTVAKLLPLLILVGVGIWFVNPEYLRWPGLPPVVQRSAGRRSC